MIPVFLSLCPNAKVLLLFLMLICILCSVDNDFKVHISNGYQRKLKVARSRHRLIEEALFAAFL
jgi:hypothetical protein